MRKAGLMLHYIILVDIYAHMSNNAHTHSTPPPSLHTRAHTHTHTHTHRVTTAVSSSPEGILSAVGGAMIQHGQSASASLHVEQQL